MANLATTPRILKQVQGNLPLKYAFLIRKIKLFFAKSFMKITLVKSLLVLLTAYVVVPTALVAWDRNVQPDNSIIGLKKLINTKCGKIFTK